MKIVLIICIVIAIAAGMWRIRGGKDNDNSFNFFVCHTSSFRAILHDGAKPR